MVPVFRLSNQQPNAHLNMPDLLQKNMRLSTYVFEWLNSWWPKTVLRLLWSKTVTAYVSDIGKHKTLMNWRPSFCSLVYVWICGAVSINLWTRDFLPKCLCKLISRSALSSALVQFIYLHRFIGNALQFDLGSQFWKFVMKFALFFFAFFFKQLDAQISFADLTSGTNDDAGSKWRSSVNFNTPF